MDVVFSWKFVEVGCSSNTEKEMEGTDCQVKLKHTSNGPDDSHISPVEFVEVVVKREFESEDDEYADDNAGSREHSPQSHAGINSAPFSLKTDGQVQNEGGNQIDNMLQSTCPPIKFEPDTSDDDNKQHVPFQNFQFVEVKNEVKVKNEVEVSEEKSGTESEMFVSKPGDESSLMSSSDQVKIISTGDPNSGNFILEIQGDTTCGLAEMETSLEKELLSGSVKIQQTIEFQQKCVSLLLCPNCESFFYSSEALASHQSNCNFINAPIEPVITPKWNSNSENQFPGHLLTRTSECVSRCKQCDITFVDKKQRADYKLLSDKSSLFNQKRIYAGEGPFSCEVCTKTFTSKKDLAGHSKFHTGERRYTCNHCGKSFHQKGGLVCHIRIHTGERPFRCEYCGKSFADEFHCSVHVISHTGMGRFRCRYCSKQFAKKSHLEAHIVSHTG